MTERALQGDCQTVPDFRLLSPPLLPLRAGQCVLVLAAPLLWDLESSRGPLWIDNIYARVERSAEQVTRDEADGTFNIIVLGGGNESQRDAWLTNMTLQNGAGYSDAVNVFGGNMLMQSAPCQLCDPHAPHVRAVCSARLASALSLPCAFVSDKLW